jgi:hypothetical protein
MNEASFESQRLLRMCVDENVSVYYYAYMYPKLSTTGFHLRLFTSETQGSRRITAAM